MNTRFLKKLRKEFLENYKIIWHNGHYWICEWNGTDGFWYIKRAVIETKSKQAILRQFDYEWRNFCNGKIREIRAQKTRVEL